MNRILKNDKEKKYRNERKLGGKKRAVKRALAVIALVVLFAGFFGSVIAGCHGEAVSPSTENGQEGRSPSGENSREGTSLSGENSGEGTSPSGENSREGTSPSGENSREGRSSSGENSGEGTSLSGESSGEGTSLSGENSGEGTSPSTEIKAPDYKFTMENFPRMDGSTAAVPMGKAVAQFLLGCSEEQAEALCSFNRTTQSFRNLMNNLCDILLVGEPNASVFTEMEESGFAYELEDIATDALVFVVNESNPVNNLTTAQIRDIYSGKITNWKEVGGENAPIKAFQRNEGAGSQALIKKLIMKDTPMTEAPQEEIISSMGELMSAVKNYDNSANALGYSVYYYANDMKMARGLKILSVDGVEPNPETIRNKAYPHRNAYYCVIPGEPVCENEQAKARSTSAKVIYDWLVTQDGQELLASIGYVSIKKPLRTASSTETAQETPMELYSTLDGKKVGEIGELKAGNSYGKLIPFIGDRIRTGDAEYGYEGQAGYLYGFLDEKGRIVADAVYTEVERLGYENPDIRSGCNTDLPMYRVSNSVVHEGTAESGEELAGARYRLISEDGSFVSRKEYGIVRAYENGILCMDKYGDRTMEYIGLDGKQMFTEQEVIKAVSETLDEATVNSIEWDSFGYLGGFYELYTTNGSFLLDGESLKALAGPYSYVCKMGGGLIQAMTWEKDGSEERTQVLDSRLQPVIKDELTYADVLKNGNIVGSNYYTGKAGLYSHDGKVLKEFDGVTYSLGTVFGFILHVPCGSSSVQQCYDANGELLTVSMSETTAMADNLEPVLAVRGVKEAGKAFRARDFDNSKGMMLYQLETGESRYLEGYNYMNPLYTWNGREEVLYMETASYEENGENTVVVIDRSLKTVLEGKGHVEALYDANEKKTYYVYHRISGSSQDEVLLDSRFKVLEENLHGDIQVCGGYVFTTDEQKTEGHKIGGPVSFRYLLASAGDD